ncbi:hypothetical protein V9T40_012074 [Parthenolecanium corni]|uniref:Uncharacterized protein n=1 Tax=Parthenolecanium corni TaxID=536013 RepID=A0AAN9T6L3_9HEMI
MRGVYSLKISNNKNEVELQAIDYTKYLDALKKANEGYVSKYFGRVSSLKKQATDICQLTRAQLITLCYWIANSEPYRRSKFQLIRLERFLPACFPHNIDVGQDGIKHLIDMVTCPYIKKYFIESLKEEVPLYQHAGVLFVSGNLGKNSALVFITRSDENNGVIYDPSGHVTEIDMTTLKKVKNIKEIVRKATEASEELDNLAPDTLDSDEFWNVDSSERPLYFKDLL